MGNGEVRKMKDSVYKVTAASIGKTQKGYEIYKLQLSNSFWVTKLIPLRSLERKYNELYKRYKENNSLEFLVGKYISISLHQSEYGVEFGSISSFDVLQDFKKELDASNGKSFATSLPIYDFLLNMQRIIEFDGSIKILSNYDDMRISKVNDVNVCYQYDISKSNDYLNFKNIDQIFMEFYKDLPLPAFSESEGGEKSYYTISMMDGGIVRMDNHIRVSHRMTTSGDYNKWVLNMIQKIGEKLPENQVNFLNKHQIVSS